MELELKEIENGYIASFRKKYENKETYMKDLTEVNDFITKFFKSKKENNEK